MTLVLIVDDERIICDYVAGILERHGYKALGATNGEDALNLLECVKVDLILLDLVMTPMDGNEFAAEVRRRANETPIVLLSCAVDKLRKDLKSEVVGSVEKPIIEADLIQAVEAALRV